MVFIAVKKLVLNVKEKLHLETQREQSNSNEYEKVHLVTQHGHGNSNQHPSCVNPNIGVVSAYKQFK